MTIRWWNYDEAWLVWYFNGMMEYFSEKFTLVVLNCILFKITGWHDSALNGTWSFSEDWSDSEICILLLKCFCSGLLAMHIFPSISSHFLFLLLFTNKVISSFCFVSMILLCVLSTIHIRFINYSFWSVYYRIWSYLKRYKKKERAFHWRFLWYII